MYGKYPCNPQPLQVIQVLNVNFLGETHTLHLNVHSHYV